MTASMIDRKILEAAEKSNNQIQNGMASETMKSEDEMAQETNRPQVIQRARNLDSFLEEQLRPEQPGTIETQVPTYIDVPEDAGASNV